MLCNVTCAMHQCPSDAAVVVRVWIHLKVKSRLL